MKRLLLCAVAVAALVTTPGCSTCRDGTSNHGIFGSSYKACVDKEKECRCSNQCPCWKKHS